MDLEFAQAIALAAYGDVWLQGPLEREPPLACLASPGLARALGPRFDAGTAGVIAHAEGPWYRWLRERGATRLRFAIVPRLAGRAAQHAAADRRVPHGAALLVEYPDRQELWRPTWRPNRAGGSWTASYACAVGVQVPFVRDATVAAGTRAWRAALAAATRDAALADTARWLPTLADAQAHLAARHLLASAATALLLSDVRSPRPVSRGDGQGDGGELLYAATVAAMSCAVNGGGPRRFAFDPETIGSRP